MSSKVLILSDYFEPKVGDILFRYVRESYNRSGLTYEENIFYGFRDVLGEKDVTMICAPTCGTYPSTSRLLISPKVQSVVEGLRYARFINIVYYRNISRYRGLISEVRKYLRTVREEDDLCVIVIQMHVPFMKVAKYIKSHHKRTKLCINIWDYPEFMNSNNLHGFKRVAKGYNTHRAYSLLKQFELLFFLCDTMKEKVGKKDYIVHEGIYSEEQIRKYMPKSKNMDFFRIVYTGKLTVEDGVLDLIDAVKRLNQKDIILEIAGGGDVEDEVIDMIKDDERFIYYGRLNSDEVVELQKKADLFVVPRLPDTYTRYSFPSKVIEYILTGTPIMCHRLDCFGKQLNGILTYIKEDDNSRLCENIIEVIEGSISNDAEERRAFIRRNMNTNIAQEILDFFDM